MFLDSHTHMVSRTTDDYERMAAAGVVACIEPAFWLGQPRTNVGSYIDGGGGNDTIYGSNGNDILIGGPGNDSVFGGDGIDGLWGDSRGGTIDSRGVSVMPYGGYGNNTLDGGNGDDGLYGANGMLDTIKCGAGNDYVIYDFVIADTYTLKPTGDCETARANGF